MEGFKSVDNFLCGVQQSSVIPKTSDNGIFSLNITSLLTKTRTNKYQLFWVVFFII